jgi:hypothetical protein
MRIALAIVGFLVMPVVATAENLETTHLFGFTLGTDVNNVGEVEGELEAIGRFAKRVGVYNALSPTLGLKFIPFQNFSIEPGVGVAYHNISNAPGLDDRQQWAFDSLSLEFRRSERWVRRSQAAITPSMGAQDRPRLSATALLVIWPR